MFKTGNVTLPDGRTNVTRTSIDISDVKPSGYTVYAATIALNTSLLPYYGWSNGAIITVTWLSNVNNETVEIANAASPWENYQYYLVLFCKKR